MYTFLRVLPIRQLAFVQMPALVCAWVIAESFYRFHSFTLECGAFLATWFVLDAATQLILAALKAAREVRHANL